MKILFLDFDGVLNTSIRLCEAEMLRIKLRSQNVSLSQIQNFALDIDPKLVENLNKVIKETGCKVVISSSWRMFGLKFCIDILELKNFKGEVIDQTPYEFNELMTRGEEIQFWLDNHSNIESFAVVDDEVIEIMGTISYTDRIAATSSTNIDGGLNDAVIDRLIQILNKQGD
ncbi:MAG: hypothetical protein KQ78_01770 [Candidatus Izimaplasma bacterium HR2]|nr:MAG: hypothetical protein KQ78_01770 [Candidatus Izimaplasma bacterium HR2]